MILRLELPLPPRLNRYYLNARRRTRSGKIYSSRRISPEGLAYRKDVWVAAVKAGVKRPIEGRLMISAEASKAALRKDGRKNTSTFDLDGLWKALLDALTYARVIVDDSQFDKIVMTRSESLDGKMSIVISDQ